MMRTFEAVGRWIGGKSTGNYNPAARVSVNDFRWAESWTHAHGGGVGPHVRRSLC